MPSPLPLRVSLIVGVIVIALVAGAALLAAYLLGKFPAYRPYRRACASFAGFSGSAAVATLLQLAFPRLNQQPYEVVLNLGWLALSVALSLYLLWGARGLKASGGLLIILGSTAMILIGNAWPLLPAPPPLIEVAAAFVAIGTGYALPYWFLWRRYLSRYFLTRRASIFTLKLAMLITAGYATCTALLFAALFWQGRHPVALLSAFAWAGAYYIGITLLSCGSVAIRSLHRRGYFQRWLYLERQQLG
jgi:hypothetical protein